MDLTINLQVCRNQWRGDYQCQVRDVHVIGLIGSSGSGKSTLLRHLAGLEPDGQGQIQVNGTAWLGAGQQLPTELRDVAMVQQDYLLFPHLTIAQQLSMVQKKSSLAAVEQDRLIQQLCHQDWLNKRPAQLSGGQQQRVALTLCLIQKPQLLLLDEPLSALDFQTRSEILQLLKAYLQEHRVAAIYTSHNLDETSMLADHCLLLQQGRIALSAPVHQVLDDPLLEACMSADQFGSVLPIKAVEYDAHDYMMRCEVIAADNAQRDPSGAVVQTLWLPVDDRLQGSTLHLQIAAKHIILANKPIHDSSLQNCLQGYVKRIQPAERQVLVVVDVSGHELKALITRRAWRMLSLQEQQPVYCHTKSLSLLSQPSSTSYDDLKNS